MNGRFSKFFDTDNQIIQSYQYDTSKSHGISFSENKFQITSGANVTFKCNILDKQTLYADCFNGFSYNLSEDWFDTLSVSVKRYVEPYLQALNLSALVIDRNKKTAHTAMDIDPYFAVVICIKAGNTDQVTAPFKQNRNKPVSVFCWHRTIPIKVYFGIRKTSADQVLSMLWFQFQKAEHG